MLAVAGRVFQEGKSMANASGGMVVALKQLVRPLAPSVPTVSLARPWRRAFRLLDHYGFRPSTVFDIGVGFGTYALYRAYPRAFYYLVDPTAESSHYMGRIARHLKCETLNIALGDRDDEASIEIRADIQGSTLFEECGPRGVLRMDRVAMRRFDSVVGHFERPALCKIDVQGAEVMVLRGMGERLTEIDVFIIESSTISTVKRGPEIYEVMQFMREHGFVLYDMIGMKRCPLDGMMAQLDLVFVKDDSVFRSDRRWARSAVAC